MTKTELKVGELAERIGLTVRTLHHYDEIGLLAPAGRTAAGHRIYGESQVRRLQQIASLRHLGLGLKEIRECLTRPDYSLDRILELQIESIRGEIGRQARLLDLIQRLLVQLRSAEGVSVDDLTQAIEVTVNYEKYYSPEQLDQLAKRAEEVGEDRIQAVQHEWEQLFADYGKAMGEGLDPSSEELKVLARRSAALIEEFTGGDARIHESLGKMYQVEGADSVLAQHGVGMPPGLWEYMGRATAALRSEG